MNFIKKLANKFGALASASLLLMFSQTIVNAGNYVYNLIMGRWLGPALFADVSLIVTLLLVVTFITAALQMTAARYSAIHTADGNIEQLASIRKYLNWVGLAFGVFLALLFSLASSFWQKVFNTSSFIPFIIFGVALPFSLIQGVNRGILQGQTRFTTLAITYQVEMWSRLFLGLFFVWMGLSVNGAVLGISLSFIATWISTLPARLGLPESGLPEKGIRNAVTLFALPVLLAQVGQILVNNSDILLVRRFYDPTSAGQYAALALIGRIVFFATWSVVTTMFPIVAQKQKRGESHRHLLWVSLGIVGGISLPVVLLAFFIPKLIIGLLFGSAYLGVSDLLWLYALATTMYALANVVVNYRLSLGMGRETGMALAAGVTQVLGIIFFHKTLAEVVWVQVIIMAALFLALLIRDLVSEAKLEHVPAK
ncbi:MAG: oligosaccharide flippase family protein [Anaerolineales bacterium]